MGAALTDLTEQRETLGDTTNKNWVMRCVRGLSCSRWSTKGRDLKERGGREPEGQGGPPSWEVLGQEVGQAGLQTLLWAERGEDHCRVGYALAPGLP